MGDLAVEGGGDWRENGKLISLLGDHTGGSSVRTLLVVSIRATHKRLRARHVRWEETALRLWQDGEDGSDMRWNLFVLADLGQGAGEDEGAVVSCDGVERPGRRVICDGGNEGVNLSKRLGAERHAK